MIATKLFRELKTLKSSIFNNLQLKTNNMSPSTYSLRDCNLFCTVIDKEKLIPFDEISNLSPSSLNCDQEKMSLLMSDIAYFKSLGKNFPQFIKLGDVADLTEFETRSQKQKNLQYLFIKEKIKLKASEKKQKKKSEREKTNFKKVPDPDRIQYGLGNNTLILRAWKRNLMKFYEKRLANSVLFGEKMVIDLGYDDYMWKKERKSCASQLRILYYFNLLSRNPYDLYFCNANPDSQCFQYLREEMPRLDESLATVSPKSYLEVFPRESLVYLSPHASETLKTYDHKAVYIIGGFVDTRKKEKISYPKAKEEGIKSYSLPLDEYMLWGQGSKSLSINQVFQIMQTFRDTGDWKEAFKHIPKRKWRRVEADFAKKKLISDKLYVMAN